MIECSQCGAQYQEPRVFCGKCRNRMGNQCRSCNFENLKDDHFCGHCGRRLAPSKPHPQPISAHPSEQHNHFLVFDQLLAEARQDEILYASTTATMDREAIKQLFHEKTG